MANLARSGARTGPVSRSGLWLIGGTVLLSVVVLAWAFQDQPAGRTTVVRRRSGTTTAPPRGSASVQVQPGAAGERIARAPSIAEYGPLLQRNVFRPLVSGGARRQTPDARRQTPGGSGTILSGPSGPTDAWRGWKFNGVAQLDRHTYALMDRMGQKQSRFVKPGDKLEDATVARVAEDEVTLREAAGGIVRVNRVDAMAELLRPSRTGPRAPQQPAAPSTAPPAAPTPPGGRSNPVATTPNPEGLRLSPAAAALEERAALRVERQQARRARRQERLREAGRLDAGETPAVSED